MTGPLSGIGIMLGEHTAEVLSEAGYSPEEIETLRSAKVIV